MEDNDDKEEDKQNDKEEEIDQIVKCHTIKEAQVHVYLNNDDGEENEDEEKEVKEDNKENEGDIKNMIR